MVSQSSRRSLGRFYRRRGCVYGYSGNIWTQHSHEFRGFWSGHKALLLASTSTPRAKRCASPVAPAAHIRFIGLSFLVPGVVSPSLPPAFAAPAAYGDLVAALLAVAASIALSARLPLAMLLVWLFNVWGTADFPFRAESPGAFRLQSCSLLLDALAFTCRKHVLSMAHQDLYASLCL